MVELSLVVLRDDRGARAKERIEDVIDEDHALVNPGRVGDSAHLAAEFGHRKMLVV